MDDYYKYTVVVITFLNLCLHVRYFMHNLILVVQLLLYKIIVR